MILPNQVHGSLATPDLGTDMQVETGTDSVWNTILSQKQHVWNECYNYIQQHTKETKGIKTGHGEAGDTAARPEAMTVAGRASQHYGKQQEVVSGLLCVR